MDKKQFLEAIKSGLKNFENSEPKINIWLEAMGYAWDKAKEDGTFPEDVHFSTVCQALNPTFEARAMELFEKRDAQVPSFNVSSALDTRFVDLIDEDYSVDVAPEIENNPSDFDDFLTAKSLFGGSRKNLLHVVFGAYENSQVYLDAKKDPGHEKFNLHDIETYEDDILYMIFDSRQNRPTLVFTNNFETLQALVFHCQPYDTKFHCINPGFETYKAMRFADISHSNMVAIFSNAGGLAKIFGREA